MLRTAAAVLGLLAGGMALAQESSVAPQTDGWKRTISADGKGYIWTAYEAEGRGAELSFHTDGWVFEIKTKESLVDMADVDDGKIKVALLSPTVDRFAIDGFLSRSQHGVSIESSPSQEIRDWFLKKENIGQKVTLIVANNGLRETYHFLNVNTTTEPEALMLDSPPEPKKRKKR